MKTTAPPFDIVLYEGNGSIELSATARTELFQILLEKGYTVSRIAGERPLAPSPRPDLDSLLVLAQFEGDAPAIEDPTGKVKVQTENIAGLQPDAVVSLVESTRGDAFVNAPGTTGAWKPWFPVIDYDRCTNCMQCLSFCLFDVYGVDDDSRIQVQNNDNCKTNCPACSRVCPEVAIMFPKYKAGPINGDEVSESDLNREKMKVDISSLLGGDIYASLRTRSETAKSRFSAERDSDKALTERKKCLTKLQADGMIPAEVLAEIDLASLPSPDEIKKKAELAEELAQKHQTN